MATLAPARPASDKQVALIEKLLGERAYAGPVGDYAGSIRVASELIYALFNSPRRPKDGAERPAPGFYVLGEDIIKVQANKAGTNVYAKRLVPSGTNKRGRFEYEPGLIDRLAGATPADADALAAYGRETGTCAICGALLSDPASVERGIGPVCAGRI
jgi:hypothetical protein